MIKMSQTLIKGKKLQELNNDQNATVLIKGKKLQISTMTKMSQTLIKGQKVPKSEKGLKYHIL